MKNKKLSIEDLQITSFITNTDYVRGGRAYASVDDPFCGTEDVTCEGAGCPEETVDTVIGEA